MSGKTPAPFFSIIILAVSICLSLALCEIGLRKIDGYPLFSIRLGAKPSSKEILSSQIPLQNYLNTIPLADNIEAGWYKRDPKPLPQKPLDPFLSFLMEKAKGLNNFARGIVMREWNRLFLLDQIQNKGHAYAELIRCPDEMVVFEPCENNPYPSYRFPANVTMPTGLTTNNFGWRGCDIELNKPANTIRICFLGSSTTVGLHRIPYSYPEYIGNWLNIWAKKNNMNIRFETINAGREGIISSVMSAIFEQEVLPLEPDFVVYYEGANQFVYRPLIKDFDSLPGAVQYEKKDLLWRLSRLGCYSALSRRLHTLWLKINKSVYEREPDKPPYVLNFPSGIEFDNPDILRTDLPLNLSDILKDLDDIHQQAARTQCNFSLVSFVWLPYEGMLLDPGRYPNISWYVNTLHWPLRYADFKRLADFQNKVLKTYAQERGINFIDLSGAFPRLPDLFSDAIHFNEEGTRLQAWIVLQELVPQIRKCIEQGELPRPDREHLAEHPCIRPGTRNGFAEIKKIK